MQVSIHNSLPTLEEIVSLTEMDEEETIKKEVDRRRMRLGASRPEKIKVEVRWEIWESSTVSPASSYLQFFICVLSVAVSVQRNTQPP